MTEGNEYTNALTEDAFRSLGFIDLDYGLECCAGLLDLYIQVVSGYVFKDSKIESLETYFQNKDWKSYEVDIHAVKSSSLLIGIKDLSQKAKDLETAAKEDNISYIMEKHYPVMEEYKKVMTALTETLGKYGITQYQ